MPSVSSFRLLCLADEITDSQMWQPVAAYFDRYHIPVSIYDVDKEQELHLTADGRSLPPTGPGREPLPPVIVSTGHTASQVWALLQDQRWPVRAVALWQPRWRHIVRHYLRPLTQPVWLALPATAFWARWRLPQPETLSLYRFTGLRTLYPGQPGWERVCHAMRRWLETLAL